MENWKIGAADRAAYEKLPVPLVIVLVQNGSGRLEALSDGVCRLVGAQRDALPPDDSDPLSAVLEEDRETARAAAQYAMMYPGDETKTVYRLKKCPSGSVKIVSTAQALRLGEGQYRIFLTCTAAAGAGAAAEAFGLYRAEERYGRQPLYLQQGGEYDPIAHWHSDLTDGRVLAYEARSVRALPITAGMDYDAACALAGAGPVMEDSREKLAEVLDRRRLIERFAAGETGFAMEYRRDENGEMPFWVSLSVNTFRSPQSGHIECYAYACDVTEKILENQLLSRLTALGYEVVGLLSVRSGKVRYFRIPKMHFGMRYEHYEDYQTSIGGDIDNIIAPEQREPTRRALRIETICAHLQQAPTYDFSYEMTTRDGRRRQKLLQFAYLDEQKDTLFLCKSDITRQYQKEQEQITQLQAAKLEADRANTAKSAFLSSMSHDLRTPLNGIIGFTNLALREQDPARKQDELEKVRSSSRLLLDLVNDTLELSRIESGKYTLEPEAVCMREMAQAVLTSLSPSAEIKQLYLDADAARFPEDVVWVDRLKFQKIFLNLLSNAIKYTPAGGTVGVRLERLDPAQDGCNYRLVVRDTGIGIEPEFLPHIFEAFSQEHRAESANIPGTGLGLAIVRRVVTLMGGKISVASRPGEGSTFTVLLPLRAAPAAAPAANTDSEQCEVRLAGLRMLLCEDNYLNTEIARILLEEKGVKVDCATNGAEGLERFSASAPGTYAAILMDIRMPVMDGYEATRRIRALARPDAGVPIVAMTADAFEEDIRNCAAAGMNGHVTKPIDPQRLYRMLQDAVNSAKTK